MTIFEFRQVEWIVYICLHLFVSVYISLDLFNRILPMVSEIMYIIYLKEKQIEKKKEDRGNG